MLKLYSIDDDGNGALTCLIDDGNLERVRSGQPLHIRCADVLTEMNPRLDIFLAWVPDLQKAAKEIKAGTQIGKVIGDFESCDLVCMVGLPKSGKTTIVRESYLPHGYAVVCPDDVRRAVHGQPFIESAEPFVWATVYAMADSLLLSGNKVVVDGTHTTEKRREPWVKCGAKFRVVETSKHTCIERAKAAGDEALIPIIERMAAQWESIENGRRTP